MSNDRLRELEEIAKILVEAREKLERLQASRNLPGTNALHCATSYAHWFSHCICYGAQPENERVFGAVCS
jgi:hypothetical protein